MSLHGRLADDEVSSDLAVRKTACDELEHLELARCQLGQLGRALGLSRSRLGIAWAAAGLAFRDAQSSEPLAATA